jgi:hypothetical protein
MTLAAGSIIINGGTLKIGTALAYGIFDPSNVASADKTYLLPNQNGTMALTSDMSLTDNGDGTASLTINGTSINLFTTP